MIWELGIEREALEGRFGILKITGDVRNVGPRSMTVLAQFTEELRSQPFTSEIRHPSFSRVQDKDGNFSSPFNIQIILE